MIVAVLGTTAELIKFSPVLNLLNERGCHLEIWNTAMHSELDSMFERLVPGVEVRLLTNPKRRDDVVRVVQAIRWASEVLWRSFRRRRDLRAALARQDRSIVLILGDTLTTVLGGIIGRMLRVPVGHIEAGYRTGRVFAPFPEELLRRQAARLASIHFAPGAQEVANLAGRRGEVINTGENTAIDALRMFLGTDGSVDAPGSYGVVTLHRFEMMRKPEALKLVIEALQAASKRRPVLFFTGPHGRARLEEHGLMDIFAGDFRLMNPLSFPEFVPIIEGAEFILTDSGGLQMEAAYLGVPCLIYRAAVESDLGVGRNVVVSEFDMAVVRDFLEGPARFRVPSMLDSARPSEIIVEHLARLGFAQS